MWAMANTMRQQYKDEEKSTGQQRYNTTRNKWSDMGTFDVSKFDVNNVMGFMLVFWKQ